MGFSDPYITNRARSSTTAFPSLWRYNTIGSTNPWLSSHLEEMAHVKSDNTELRMETTV